MVMNRAIAAKDQSDRPGARGRSGRYHISLPPPPAPRVVRRAGEAPGATALASPRPDGAGHPPFLRTARSPDRARLGRRKSAIIYSEANFGGADGKTANGLVRHSERYEILAVIDSEKAGLDAGEVLGDGPNAIPIRRDVAEALACAGCTPDYFIIGIAPATGLLTPRQRRVVLEAMALGMNVVNGLHEFLNDDPEFRAMGVAKNVEIVDVRRPRAKKDLRIFSGRLAEVTCPRIAVLGTDCAIGKRTTATILTRALNDRGVRTVLVGTGQTGLIQGPATVSRSMRFPRNSARASWRRRSSTPSRASDPT